MRRSRTYVDMRRNGHVGASGSGRCFFERAQFGRKSAVVGAQHDIPARSQRARVDDHGAADAIHGLGFMNVPAQADIRLRFLNEFAHGCGTYVNAVGQQIAGRVFRRIV